MTQIYSKKCGKPIKDTKDGKTRYEVECVSAIKPKKIRQV